MEEELELLIKNNRLGRDIYEKAFRCDKKINELAKKVQKSQGLDRYISLLEYRHYIRCSKFFKRELKKLKSKFSKLKL